MLFWPVLVNMALVIFLYFKLVAVKKQAVAEGTVDEERRSLHDDAWPDSVMKVNNCIRNQFEVPVLFYAVMWIITSVGAQGPIALTLAWVFVVTRILHAREHIGDNFVPRRRRYFTIGVVMVLLLVLRAAWELL